jgi:hypothetical protein
MPPRPSPTPPSPPSRSLRRDAQSLSQVLQLTGWVYPPPLPPSLDSDIVAAGLLRSTGVTPLQSYYKPSRRRLVFGRFPGPPGYTTHPAPPISRWNEDGFSSCSTCPCHRAAPPAPMRLFADLRRRFEVIPGRLGGPPARRQPRSGHSGAGVGADPRSVRSPSPAGRLSDVGEADPRRPSSRVPTRTRGVSPCARPNIVFAEHTALRRTSSC